MNLHEFQSKRLFAEYGIPVPNGAIADSAAGAIAAARGLGGGVWVVKAQVHAGGRGKAGGVKLAKDLDAVGAAAAGMLGTRLVTHQTGPEGLPVERVYVEQGSNIAREYYLSVVLNRDAGRIAFVASAAGGMEIEEVAERELPALIVLQPGGRMHVDPQDLVRLALRDLLDVHPARGRGDERDAPGVSVQHDAEIVLAGDGRALFDVDPLHRQPLRAGLVGHESGAEHARRRRTDRVEVLRELDPARLAAAAGVHLRFHDPDAPSEPACGRDRPRRRIRDRAFRHRDAVLGEQLLRLELMQIHGRPFPSTGTRQAGYSELSSASAQSRYPGSCSWRTRSNGRPAPAPRSRGASSGS